MKKYLYGAAIQGIQSFIFQTNELQDITGASELVDRICTEEFKAFYGADGESGLIIGAAGNIKYDFSNENDCKKVVREFPKKVMTMAPGVTISQAVVVYDDTTNENFEKAIDDIEKKLKAQRNKSHQSLTLGLTGISRSRTTGLPLTVKKDKEVYLDDSTYAKRQCNKLITLSNKSFFGKEPRTSLKSGNIAFDISDITDKNDWIAIIHADGNGLGKVVQKVGKNKADFKYFSEQLNTSTIRAANDAFKEVSSKFIVNGVPKGKIPIRPVVLGGDDMTVIIRGDLAIPYVRVFMEKFEYYTQQFLGKERLRKYEDCPDKLTACAGVAFIKSSYPFYYGYNLAEELCTKAKKDAKDFAGEGNVAPSCLMFHKVQDSFVENYEAIAKRELLTKDGSSFMYGPYYVHNENKPVDRLTINELIEISEALKDEDGNAIKSNIRQWLTLMHNNEKMASQKLGRIESLYPRSKVVRKLTVSVKRDYGNNIKRDTYLAYDVLSYHSVMNQITKGENKDEDD